MIDSERVELDLHEIETLFKDVKKTAPKNWKSSQRESIKKLYDVLSKSEEILWDYNDELQTVDVEDRPISHSEDIISGERETEVPRMSLLIFLTLLVFTACSYSIVGTTIICIILAIFTIFWFQTTTTLFPPRDINHKLSSRTSEIEGVNNSSLKSSEVDGIIRFFRDQGDILRFEKIQEFKNKFFTQPKRLVKDCR